MVFGAWSKHLGFLGLNNLGFLDSVVRLTLENSLYSESHRPLHQIRPAKAPSCTINRTNTTNPCQALLLTSILIHQDAYIITTQPTTSLPANPQARTTKHEPQTKPSSPKTNQMQPTPNPSKSATRASDPRREVKSSKTTKTTKTRD